MEGPNQAAGQAAGAEPSAAQEAAGAEPSAAQEAAGAEPSAAQDAGQAAGAEPSAAQDAGQAAGAEPSAAAPAATPAGAEPSADQEADKQTAKAALESFLRDPTQELFSELSRAVCLYGLDASGAEQVVEALAYKLAHVGVGNIGDASIDLHDSCTPRRTDFAANVFKQLSEEQQVEAVQTCLQLFQINCQHPDSVVVELLFYFVKHSAKCAAAVSRVGGVSVILQSQLASRDPMRCVDGATALCADNQSCCQEFIDCGGMAMLRQVHAVSLDALATLSKGLVCVSACVLPTVAAYRQLHSAAGSALWNLLNIAKLAGNVNDKIDNIRSEAATGFLRAIAKAAKQLGSGGSSSCVVYQQCGWEILLTDSLWQHSTVEAACTMLLTCADLTKVQAPDMILLSQLVQGSSSVSVKLSAWKLLKFVAVNTNSKNGTFGFDCHAMLARLAVCILHAALRAVKQDGSATCWQFIKDVCKEVHMSKVQCTAAFHDVVEVVEDQDVGGIGVLVKCLAAGVAYLRDNNKSSVRDSVVLPTCVLVVNILVECKDACKLHDDLVRFDGDSVLDQFVAWCANENAGQSAQTAILFVKATKPVTNMIRVQVASAAQAQQEKQQLLDRLERANRVAQACRKEVMELEQTSSAKVQAWAELAGQLNGIVTATTSTPTTGL